MSDLVLCKQYMQIKSSYCTRREQWHQKTTRKQCVNHSTAAPGSVPWLKRCKVAIRDLRASEAQGLTSLSWLLWAELHLSSLHQTQLRNRSDFWRCPAFFLQCPTPGPCFIASLVIGWVWRQCGGIESDLCIKNNLHYDCNTVKLHVKVNKVDKKTTFTFSEAEIEQVFFLF